MSTIIGFDKALVATMDDNENIRKGNDPKALYDSGIYDLNAKTAQGVTSANISGLAPSTTNIVGSNQVVGVSGRGTGQVTLDFKANSIPEKIVAKLSGAKLNDATGAWEYDKNTISPWACIELVSSNDKGDAVHVALYKGRFTVQPQSMNTNNGTGGESRSTDSLQFKAVNRATDSKVLSKGFENADGFNIDNFRKDLFPGADLDQFNKEEVTDFNIQHNGDGSIKTNPADQNANPATK